MDKFIMVTTLQRGDDVYINIDHIRSFNNNETKSDGLVGQIWLSSETMFLTRQTAAEIVGLIQKATESPRG